MERSGNSEELCIEASVGQYLACAPVAFAVTEGPSHAVLYANGLFRALQTAGTISIGPRTAREPPPADLTPLLAQAFHSGETVRDAILDPPDHQTAAWSCTIWPAAPSGDSPKRLVIEVHDVALMEGARVRQRAVAEHLLLGALREQDVAHTAQGASGRADYLAKASRDLSMSLDEGATRDAIRQLALPRPGTWCIVDVAESNGAVRRLPVVHPDLAKRELARLLETQTPSQLGDVGEMGNGSRLSLTPDSGATLMRVAHGEADLRILGEIGFGALLTVPLIVRARVQGTITFVSREGDPPFNPEEIALAVDLASRCAMALDNARLYREADALRMAAELGNKSKSEFLGNMSHELRTPLNAIGGFAELIEMGVHGPVTREQASALARIKANQQHLLMLITEILNFVRMESGRLEYRNADVSMTGALALVADMLSGVIREKELTLVTSPDDLGAVAWADPNRVSQVLVNLVMNAVKYTSRGGTITLGCTVLEDVVLGHVWTRARESRPTSWSRSSSRSCNSRRGSGIDGEGWALAWRSAATWPGP